MLAKAGQEDAMTIVNMLEAKTSLSKLVEAVESGAEKEIILARNGKPAARIVPLALEKPRIRLGLADGRYVIGEPDPELDAEVAALFGLDE
jgi:prevent-host-death family protein